MKNTDNLNEMLELRNLGYGPAAIATHFKMHKGTVSVILSDYALKNKINYPPMHRRLVDKETHDTDDRVSFDFQEGKYRGLTGLITKINASSFIIKLDLDQAARFKNERWWIEGNGCVCVSKDSCKAVSE